MRCAGRGGDVNSAPATNQSRRRIQCPIAAPSVSSVCIASSIDSFRGADALAASALAGRENGVILLAQSNPDFYPPESTDMALKFLTDHKGDIQTVHVLGGETANTLEFFDQIDNMIDPE